MVSFEDLGERIDDRLTTWRWKLRRVGIKLGLVKPAPPRPPYIGESPYSPSFRVAVRECMEAELKVKLAQLYAEQILQGDGGPMDDPLGLMK